MGGIRVERAAHEFGFVEEALGILEKKGTVLIFPESRLPVEGEERPLPFKESVAYLALRSGVPVVPVYTNGSYFRFKRARVVVGKPVLPAEWIPEATPEKEAMQEVTARLRETVIALGKQLP
jgi:1-acyl-sn-glycerol-3-phosphate acyltransferase